MNTLTLHYHPLSSYCQKLLIAADVLGVALDKRLLDPGDPAQRAAHRGRPPPRHPGRDVDKWPRLT